MGHKGAIICVRELNPIILENVNSRRVVRVSIPTNLRLQLLHKFQDNSIVGDLGCRMILVRVSVSCHISELKEFVNRYITLCDTCQMKCL